MEKKSGKNRRKVRRLPVIGNLVIIVDGRVRTYEVTEEGCVINNSPIERGRSVS